MATDGESSLDEGLTSWWCFPRSTDEDEAFKDIAKISRIVYDFQRQLPAASDQFANI